MSSQNGENGSTSSSGQWGSQPGTNLEQAAGVAAQAFLPKAAKLEVAEKAFFLQDQMQLQARELHNTQRYLEKKVFGDSAGKTFSEENEMSPRIIVCDNVYGDDAAETVFGVSKTTTAQPQPAPVRVLDPAPQPTPQPTTADKPGFLSTTAGKVIAGTIIGGSLLGAGVAAPYVIDKLTSQGMPAVVQPADKDTQYEYKLELK